MKIVPFVAQDDIDKQGDRESALESLDTIRELIVSGKVTSVAIVAMASDGRVYTEISRIPHFPALLGGISLLDNRAMKMWIDASDKELTR